VDPQGAAALLDGRLPRSLIKEREKMNEKNLAFTAVFLELNGEYVAFIEELPAMNAHGRSIGEARKALYELAAEVFDEERRNVDETLRGKGIFRESMVIPANAS
jgi:predicted RNase H-like HicB family nuclease